MNEVDGKGFLELVGRTWKQGEHLGLIGPTGTGKTHTAQELLEFREWVCVMAVKRKDDSLDRFKNGDKYGFSHYCLITKWPPNYGRQRVILWAKPDSLEHKELNKQKVKIYLALSDMYKSGGWCTYFDEVGYVAGVLGLGSELGILPNQGRSSHITIALTMTRPSSVVARVPKEALNQLRHTIIFKYTNKDESDICAQIVGINKNAMWQLMSDLRYHSAKSGNRFSDCLYFHEGEVYVVRTATEDSSTLTR